MNHVLDNMIWQALCTGNRELALLEEKVGCYHPEIAPFAAVAERDRTGFDRLHAFLPAGRKIAIAYFDPPPLDPAKWETLRQMDCCQMVYEHPVPAFTTPQSSRIVPLTDEHIPQMLELTALTKPGPFFQQTIRFGNYYGIFEGGRLAAMSGQRMHPVPYLEVSAVCSHPDFRGQGLAKALMLRVMEGILDQTYIPFLHVLTSNTGAIQLYESIGFRTRRRIQIDMIRPLG